MNKFFFTYGATSTLEEQVFTMEAATGNFFASPHFAVAGASSDVSKYGHKSRDSDIHKLLLRRN